MANYAFIDNQNLNLGIKNQGWNLHWEKFRIYLREKYKVDTAYLFLGYIKENQDLYQSLQKSGYILIFKEILKYKDGTIKGNCDAELVLQAMIDYTNYNKCVIVSGDGDFSCLISYMVKQGKLLRVIVPNENNYSALIKKSAGKLLTSMNNLKNKLQYIKRTP